MDFAKVRATFNANEKECWHYIRGIINLIPREDYLRLATGQDEGEYGDEDGHIHMVFVLEEGDDKKVLEAKDLNVPSALALVAKDVLTHGIWLNHD